MGRADAECAPGSAPGADADVLESRPPLLRPIERRWRWPLVLAVLAVLAGLAGPGRDWLVERGLQDQLSLATSVQVAATSTTPPGGSVRYAVRIHNTGPRRARIVGVHFSDARLQLSASGYLPLLLASGATGDVPLSVRLDCTVGRPPDPTDGLGGTIDAVPLSGRSRPLTVRLDQAFLITDVAAMLCSVRPGLTGAELSGPVITA